MEWIRWQKSPWGQEVVLGLAWDVAALALAAGVLFALGHALLSLRAPRKPAADGSGEPAAVLARLPARILRHTLAARSIHWVMALSVLTLLFTAFLPIVGVTFSWVTPHWIAGVVLTAAVLFHLAHTTVWKGLRPMWIGRGDVRAAMAGLRQIVDPRAPDPTKAGKNPVENKFFHHGAAVATLAAVLTGLIMLAKVDAPWWARNPYLLSEDAWGLIYLVHGVGSVALIALAIVHLYFAARPDKRWITASMLRGWIARERYLGRHDPRLWPPVAAPDASRSAPERGRP